VEEEKEEVMSDIASVLHNLDDLDPETWNLLAIWAKRRESKMLAFVAEQTAQRLPLKSQLVLSDIDGNRYFWLPTNKESLRLQHRLRTRQSLGYGEQTVKAQLCLFVEAEPMSGCRAFRSVPDYFLIEQSWSSSLTFCDQCLVWLWSQARISIPDAYRGAVAHARVRCGHTELRQRQASQNATRRDQERAAMMLLLGSGARWYRKSSGKAHVVFPAGAILPEGLRPPTCKHATGEGDGVQMVDWSNSRNFCQTCYRVVRRLRDIRERRGEHEVQPDDLSDVQKRINDAREDARGFEQSVFLR
jgi:hypothetical protein